ncbi:tyrosine-type recombinase/integrase [Pseudophaeobacter sp. A-200-2]|uniref:tyrosine-type recombinase/integrase n=1 Tax=Pseudophaeobacter sp. A-200-2 TaxID=3098145 RepID=UPI0034D68C81
MAISQPHLERRKTGFFWRRRVPARASNRFKPTFFCFPLRTHVPREAAELARRLTSISELCFDAETEVRPEIFTSILTGYARFEIDAFDHLRALSGPRTRQAAETALEIEAAARASLRDAIFLCDHSVAISPIHDTARRLGLEIEEDDEDIPVLMARMVRLMVEISEEKDRRAKGIFSDTQPYLQMALHTERPSPAPQHARCMDPAPESSEFLPEQPALKAEETGPANSIQTVSVDETKQSDEIQKSDVFFQRAGLKISVSNEPTPPARTLDGSPASLLDLWDGWFKAKEKGQRQEGAYEFEDAELGENFTRNSDTVQSTRKLIADMFGTQPIDQMLDSDWKAFNDMLFQLPQGHGKSPLHKKLHCSEIITRARKKAEQEMRKAELRIKKQKLSDDAAEALRHKATLKTLAPRTVQRHQAYLNMAINHAVDKGVISHNPFKRYVLSEKTITELRKARPDTSRKLWHDDFQVMLATDKWNSPKTRINDHIYWVPLISRLHGLRSEEALQLGPKNVRSEDGIHYFDILKGTGTSLKSNNARRLIPIHSQLIELGFLELVAHQRKLGRSRLFDQVSRSKTKKANFTANFTKNFTYYRKSRGIYCERMDLHALRTSCNTKMVENALPDTARRYLIGHKNGDVGIINYLPEGFPLKTQKAYIEMDQIDISMITRRFGKAEKPRKGPYLAVEDGVEVPKPKSA